MSVRRGWALGVFLAAAGCQDDARPECQAGEVIYTGRPPARLFDFITECRDDCFAGSSVEQCDTDCGRLEVGEPLGALLGGDRELWVVDALTLGQQRALVFTFAYVDEAGGTAPPGWSFLQNGPASYLAEHVSGTARFVMDTRVVTYVEDDGRAGVPRFPGDGVTYVPDALVGEAVPVTPGRLEILAATAERLAGRFYLSYETLTGQPQGQVNGCFDLSIVSSSGSGAELVRVLGR